MEEASEPFRAGISEEGYGGAGGGARAWPLVAAASRVAEAAPVPTAATVAVGLVTEVVDPAGVGAEATVAPPLPQADPLRVTSDRGVAADAGAVSRVPDGAHKGDAVLVRAGAAAPRPQKCKKDPPLLQAAAVAAPLKEEAGEAR